MDNMAYNEMANVIENSFKVCKNPLLTGFLDNDNNRHLLRKFIEYPNENTYEELNCQFRKFYIEIRLIKYFSQIIHYHSLNFAKKSRRYRYRNLLVIDNDSSRDYKHIKEIETPDITEYLNSDKLLDCIENDHIQKVLRNITKKQMVILDLLFIKQLTVKEISISLGVTSQYIYKVLNSVKKRIKKEGIE